MKLKWSSTNLSGLLAAVLPTCLTALNHQDKQVQSSQDGERDNGAVMYIVAVLTFYSVGVIVMIIHYLRSDSREFEEEVVQENGVMKVPKTEHPLNQVGQQVFETVTSISYEDDYQNDSPRTLIISDL